jgi:hypothetical protein
VRPARVGSDPMAVHNRRKQDGNRTRAQPRLAGRPFTRRAVAFAASRGFVRARSQPGASCEAMTNGGAAYFHLTMSNSPRRPGRAWRRGPNAFACRATQLCTARRLVERRFAASIIASIGSQYIDTYCSCCLRRDLIFQRQGFTPERACVEARGACEHILRRSAVWVRGWRDDRPAACATHRLTDKPLQKAAGAVRPGDLSCARSCQRFARVADP